MSSKFTTGDIFTFEVDDNIHVYGRVLLNFSTDCVEGNSINSAIDQFYNILGKTLIAEIYSNVSTNGEKQENYKTLFPVVLLDYDGIDSGDWNLIDHKQVTQEEIDFPELISGDNEGKLCFVKGEVCIPLSSKRDYWENRIESSEDKPQINLIATAMNSIAIGDYVLYAVGMHDELSNLLAVNVPLNSYKSIYRYLDGLPELRKEVYGNIGEDPNMPYHELALKHGYDISRFLK